MPDEPRGGQDPVLQQGPAAQVQERLARLLTLQASQYQSPIPPPEIVAGYERVLPGAAERILAMAERQSAHRLRQEERVVTHNIEREKTGQWMAFAVSLVVIAGGIGLAWTGRSVTGLMMVIGDLAALAGVFVYGRRAQEQERREKREGLEPQAPPAPAPSPATSAGSAP